MSKDKNNEIKKLLQLKEKVRDQILGNDYYIAQDLKSLEKKIDDKIKQLSQMHEDKKEMI